MEINFAGKLIGWGVALVVMAGWSLWVAVRKREPLSMTPPPDPLKEGESVTSLPEGERGGRLEPFNGVRGVMALAEGKGKEAKGKKRRR